MGIVERIQVIFEGINKMNAPARAVSQSLKQVEMNTQAYQNVAANTNISVNKATRYFKENNLTMQNASTAVNTLTGQTQSLGQVTDKASKEARRFNFAWLSVMFAGMALNRVFGGLIKSQLKLFGITELFGGVLTLVMLPIMMVLLPFFLWLSQIFMNLSPEIKMVIGVFIILGALFGIILLVVGQMMLAIQGIGGIFGLAGAAAAIAILGIMIVLFGIGLVIAGIIIIVKNWGKDFSKVAKGIVLVLGGIAIAIMGVLVIMGLMPFAWALVGILIVAGVMWLAFQIIKHWDEIRDALIIAWAHIKNAFRGGWNNILGFFEWGINRIIDMVNRIPGINIDYVNLSNFKKELEDVGVLANKLALQRNVDTFQRELDAKAKEVTKPTEAPEDFISKLTGGKYEKDFMSKLIPEEYKGMIPEATEGGTAQEININNNNTFNVSDKEEMEKMLDENNIKTVDEIKRQIGV